MSIIDDIFREDFRLSQGVPRTIRRRENVKNALENRFAVSKGSIPFRPSYGANLKRYSNEPVTKELENTLIKEVEEQILRDPRVKNIRKIIFSSNQEGLVQINIEINLVGERDNFQFRVVI